MVAARRGALALALLLALFSTQVAAQRTLYCGEDDCYYLLGLDRYDSPTTKEIKKAYRALSRELHPDRNLNDPDAAAKFAKVAVAYETLVDPEVREEYHYYRDHPEDLWSNSMRYYARVYKPKSDMKIVVSVFLVGISALHWALMQLMHKRGKGYVKKYHPGFQKKVKELARERMAAKQGAEAVETSSSTSDVKNRKKGGKGKKRATAEEKAEQERELEALEQEIADELIDEVALEGSYKKPTVHDIILVKLIKLPYTVPVSLVWYASWFYRHSIRKLPYTREEQTYLLTGALNRSEELLRQEFQPADFERLYELECWHRENFRALQEEIFKRDNPERYKQYRRYLKSDKGN
mmetsp:Transcript_3931/g.12402  ORF Transcript_3931/g.12402 Transcript_3931/m.12402 type:complete len:352 (+) Transcript_3931:941-1996(+)